MTAFSFKALDDKGRTQKGVMQSDSAKQVRQKLRDKGLFPVEIEQIEQVGTNKTTSGTKFLRRGKRVKMSDLALLTRQLATLLAAGLPVEESVLGVAEQSEKIHIKNVLHGVRAKVLEGHSLSTAMSNFPNAFPELYCATVGAGEQTGHLDMVLSRLADYTEQQQNMRQKIQQALIYPAVMTTISIAIVSFLLISVVPKIINVFSSTGQELPLVTTLLIGMSDIVKNYGIFILGFFIAFFYAFYRVLQLEKFRIRWHSFLLRLPFLGYAIRMINTARYARTFGILFSAGVTVLEAMRVSASLITNLPMKKKIKDASSLVKEGTNINIALKQTKYFSPMCIHLIASGENSGHLSQMLEKAADNQDVEISRLIETVLTLFEPLIILLMGAVVLFIVLAILLPIFQMDQFTG